MASQLIKKLHPNNIHQHGYDFSLLVQSEPSLNQYLTSTPTGNCSIDFANPVAVKLLNKALLKQYYHIDFWDIPESYLCPAVPGRVDYIHYLADLIGFKQGDKPARMLDIGTGASCIYPLLAAACYKWQSVATDIDSVSVKTAEAIVKANAVSNKRIKLKLQKNPHDIFNRIIQKQDWFDVTICNPPFHKSLADATKGSERKVKNLTGKLTKNPELNFAGQKAELWCPGGEVKFISIMIEQSRQFASQVGWFTSLISKKDSLIPLKKVLAKSKVTEYRVINMAQGNKVSRILAWRF